MFQERERETETETDRQTDRQTGKEIMHDQKKELLKMTAIHFFTNIIQINIHVDNNVFFCESNTPIPPHRPQIVAKVLNGSKLWPQTL